MIEGILLATATGGDRDNRTYQALRQALIEENEVKELLPSMVRTNRNLDTFWPYIQREAAKYAERREIIGQAFNRLMDHLDGRKIAPNDKMASDILETFDADAVHAVWEKALARRDSDPEGAITVARTLLEAVTKRILDELNEAYSEKDDLPKLYTKAAKVLNLAPNQNTEEPIKAILGGAMNLVNGIGTLRNRLSDSHARGGKLPVKPSPRHTSLAVNTAGAVATFLVETFLARQERS
jgi:hypothetical protein